MKKDTENYIKAEVISEKNKKRNKNEYNTENIDYENIKKAMFSKGISFIFPYIASFLFLFSIIILIIFILFDSPFDYIFTAILLFFLVRFIIRIYKALNGK